MEARGTGLSHSTGPEDEEALPGSRSGLGDGTVSDDDIAVVRGAEGPDENRPSELWEGAHGAPSLRPAEGVMDAGTRAPTLPDDHRAVAVDAVSLAEAVVRALERFHAVRMRPLEGPRLQIAEMAAGRQADHHAPVAADGAGGAVRGAAFRKAGQSPQGPGARPDEGLAADSPNDGDAVGGNAKGNAGGGGGDSWRG